MVVVVVVVDTAPLVLAVGEGVVVKAHTPQMVGMVAQKMADPHLPGVELGNSVRKVNLKGLDS
jgi:hypothetical protein